MRNISLSKFEKEKCKYGPTIVISLVLRAFFVNIESRLAYTFGYSIAFNRPKLIGVTLRPLYDTIRII